MWIFSFNGNKFIFLLIFVFSFISEKAISTPSENWQAVDSSNFTIYFKAGHKAWANKALEEAEHARHLVLTKLGQSLNKKVNIYVIDPFVGSNGYALPSSDQPTMVLFVTPPTSDAYVGQGFDWQKMAVLHEYLHLVHLSEKYSSIWTRHLHNWMDAGPHERLSVPAWIAEGYAIHMESKLTQKGRLDNEFVKALFDEYVSKGALPSYAALSEPSSNYQAEVVAHVTSALFFRWLEEKLGAEDFESFWSRWRMEKNGSFEKIFSNFFNKDVKSYYGQFIALSTYQVLSLKSPDFLEKNSDAVLKQFDHTVASPVLSRDTKRLCLVEDVVVGHRSAKRLMIYEFVYTDASGKREVRKLYEQEAMEHANIYGIDWLDSNIVLYSASDRNAEGEYIDNLYAWDLRQNKVLIIKEGSHIRRFDVSYDKKYIAAEKTMNGHSDIVIVKVADLSEEIPLVQGELGQVFDFPKVSYQGDQIAYLQHDATVNWQLVVYSFTENKKQLIPLPENHSYVSHPQWSRDGRFLYFVAGAERAVDLYAYDFSTGALEKKTHGYAPILWPLIINQQDILYFTTHADGHYLIADKQLIFRHAGPHALADQAPPPEKPTYDQRYQRAKGNNLNALMYNQGQPSQPPPAFVPQPKVPINASNPQQAATNTSPQPVYAPQQVIQQPIIAQPQPVQVIPQPQPVQVIPQPQPVYMPQQVIQQPAIIAQPQQIQAVPQPTVMPQPRQVQTQPTVTVQPQPIPITAQPVRRVQVGAPQQVPVEQVQAAVPAESKKPLNAKERAYKRFNKINREESNDIDSFLNAIIEGPIFEPEKVEQPKTRSTNAQSRPSSDYLNQTPPVQAKEQHQYADTHLIQYQKSTKKKVSHESIDTFFNQRRREHVADVYAGRNPTKPFGIGDFFEGKSSKVASNEETVDRQHTTIGMFFQQEVTKKARVAALNESALVVGVNSLPQQVSWYQKKVPAYDPLSSKEPPFNFTASDLTAGGAIGSNCWVDVGRKYQLDAWLLYGIAESRSGLNPMKISGKAHKKNMGIMQVSSALLSDLEDFGIEEKDLLDPCTNIHVAAWGINNAQKEQGDTWLSVALFFESGDKQKIKDTEKRYAKKMFDHYQALVASVKPERVQYANLHGPKANLFLHDDAQQADVFFMDSPLKWGRRLTQAITGRREEKTPLIAIPRGLTTVSESLNTVIQAQNLTFKVCSAFKKSAYDNNEAAVDDLYNAEIELINLKRKQHLTHIEFKGIRQWMDDTRGLIDDGKRTQLEENLLPQGFCESS